jgi:hypothetical protein
MRHAYDHQRHSSGRRATRTEEPVGPYNLQLPRRAWPCNVCRLYLCFTARFAQRMGVLVRALTGEVASGFELPLAQAVNVQVPGWRAGAHPLIAE